MQVLRLDVERFRGVRTMEFRPHTGMNVLVGASNCGKSTVLAALDLVLGPDHAYMREDSLSRFDVWGAQPARGDTVKVGVALGLSEEEWRAFPDLEEPLDLAKRAWDPPGEAQTPAEIDESHALRVALFYQWDRPEPDDRLVTFFPKYGPPGGLDCRRVTRRQREVLGFALVPYDEPLWQVSGLSASSRLSRYARRRGWDPLHPNAVPDLVKRATDALQATSSNGTPPWDAMDGVLRLLADSIGRIAPGISSGARAELTSVLTDSAMQRFLEVGLRHTDGEAAIPVSRHGTGLQRSFGIAAHAECARTVDGGGAGGAGVLAVDEPEVGLHPMAQRSLLAELRRTTDADAPQMFVATHSGAVLAGVTPQDVWVLRNKGGTVEARGLAGHGSDREAEHTRKNVERYWNLIAPALFGRAALVVEGPAEEGALPVFDGVAKGKVDGYSGMDAAEIAMVAAGGTGSIPQVARGLRAFGVPTVVLHDFDTADDAKKVREDIAGAADLVLHWPDDDRGRDLERVMMGSTTKRVLREIMALWADLWESDGQTFARWVADGLGEGGRDLADKLRQAEPQDVPSLIAETYANESKNGVVGDWYLRQVTKGKPFGKSVRYARLWAEKCVEHGEPPGGLHDLFVRIGSFVAQGQDMGKEHGVYQLRI